MGKYALLIGVDTYGEGLQPLPAASKDVAALREVLLNSHMGGFDEAKLLINPTQPEMAQEIELWFQDRQPDDLVLLFFSGHGVKDDRRSLYFAAANTEKRRDRLVRSTATSARFLHDCIHGCKAKYQVLILDCCFSGAFGDLIGKDDGEIPLKEQLGAEGRVVLTSTSAVDYSFEEKGADLSIYTRYLVEGIATGAADEDGDGVITVDELHSYAGRKVKETSPAMSPSLITLKDEGFRIRLARSPQDAPNLKYRKEAERRATAAAFTIPAQQLLVGLRRELGLSDTEAEEIEAEVLKPQREYQRKRQEYQETLRQCLERESPLSQQTIDDLKDYCVHLRLKPEDVAIIERSVLSGHDLEGYVAELERQRQAEAQQQAEAQRRQQEQAEAERQQRESEAERIRQVAAQRQREEAERQKQAEAKHQTRFATIDQPKLPESSISLDQTDHDDLSSERFGENYYAQLRDFLVAKDWGNADMLTEYCMREVMDRQEANRLGDEDIKNFPHLDLRNIDNLWVKYSQGRFGFSVQKEVWKSCGSPKSYTFFNKEWEKFGDTVGWRQKAILGLKKWSYWKQLTFNEDAPKGHLPGCILIGWWWAASDPISADFSASMALASAFLSREDL
jgi:uncharacterized caspase-like protein